MHTTPDDDRDPWDAEAAAWSHGFCGGDYEAAAAAELPAELAVHAEAAALDPGFDDTFGIWMDRLLNDGGVGVLLVLEQSCHDGRLLPADLRATRLASAPAPAVAMAERLITRCPRHVLAHLALHAYWMVRFERARRRGAPEWSPSLPMWPEPAMLWQTPPSAPW